MTTGPSEPSTLVTTIADMVQTVYGEPSFRGVSDNGYTINQNLFSGSKSINRKSSTVSLPLGVSSVLPFFTNCHHREYSTAFGAEGHRLVEIAKAAWY